MVAVSFSPTHTHMLRAHFLYSFRLMPHGHPHVSAVTLLVHRCLATLTSPSDQQIWSLAMTSDGALMARYGLQVYLCVTD
jgi:hypothetical protein